MSETYLGEIELTDETLAHYGVKGMKWRYHKPKIDAANASDAYKRLASMSDKDYNDLLSRIKLTKSSKGGKSAASKEKKEKAAKGSSSEKKASSGKGSTEKKETATKAEKATAEKQTKATDEKKTQNVEERVVYKQQVDPEYTKWLERQQAKANESKLDSTQVKERMADAEARKRRRAMGVKKIFARM